MSSDDDLKAAATYSAQDADATGSAAATIYGTVKTGAEVKAKFDYYKSFAPYPLPKNPTLADGAKWSAGALENYAKANGKTWVKEAGGTLIQNVATAYGYSGYIPSEIPTNEKEAADALVNIGCAAIGDYTGINPKIAEVTVEALMDGKLDKNDCESIGATAGSIAGAAICQMYGIPAPIGAFLGGEIGGFIGGEVADIFGFSKRAHDEWLKKQKELAVRELSSAEAACAQIREGYWTTFDAYVLATERRWEDLEVKVGYKFDVRFFGQSPSAIANYIDQHPGSYAWQSRLGPRACAVTCPDGIIVKQSGATEILGKLSAADYYALQQQCRLKMIADTKLPPIQRAAYKIDPKFVPNIYEPCTHECLADYGCPYPDLNSFVTHYPKFPELLSSTQRVCAAYRALGFVWQAPIGPELFRSWGVVRTGNNNADFAAMAKAITAHAGEYRNTTCLLPPATMDEIKSKKRHAAWLSWLNTMLSIESKKVSHLNTASVRLIGDLAKTAAMVKVQQQFSDANVRKSLKGADGISTTSASSWVNNGALVAGLGWLAYNSRSR
jgi:hypothetical protein